MASIPALKAVSPTLLFNLLPKLPQGAQQPDQHSEREASAGERHVVTPAPNTFTSGNFHASHRPPSGMARGYVCSQCGKAFSRLHQFKLHQQSHKRKRAFWCTVCGKNFQCSSHLSIHYRTHTGEKPFGCGQCGKRFTQQSSLRVHQRTHSGERPYSCSLCGKSFIMMHHLKRHRIIHTYKKSHICVYGRLLLSNTSFLIHLNILPDALCSEYDVFFYHIFFFSKLFV
uniref:C2H2-type domain-containing protein n=1 Tax=Labrus bergylta TaxID=56723 RepID=A0A3Q3L8V7_9LABR